MPSSNSHTGATDRARLFFDAILAADDPFARVSAFVNSSPPTYETEWLDFKSGGASAEKAAHKIWSESLSAFANTEGGVLLWGLDCRRDDSGVDQVVGKSLVAEPEAFVSKLRSMLSQMNSPPVAGVHIDSVPDPEDGNRGYVVCYIPESANKPHRAELAGRNYYLRIGDSSVVPPVSLLRSLFFPGSKTSFTLKARKSRSTGGMRFELLNTGTVSAEDVMVTVRFGGRRENERLPLTLKPGHYWKDHGDVDGMRRLVPDFTLHPDVRTTLFRVTAGLGEDLKAPSTPGDLEHWWFRIRLYAKNQPAQEWLLEGDARALLSGRVHELDRVV
jgi:hypothetical protein